MAKASGSQVSEQKTTPSRVSSSKSAKASAAKGGAKKQTGRRAAVIPRGNAKTKSGIPKGASAAYVKKGSCGRDKHNYVMAKTGSYAVCTKCHSRRSFPKE